MHKKHARWQQWCLGTVLVVYCSLQWMVDSGTTIIWFSPMQGWLDKQIKVMGVSRINLGSVCSGSVLRSLPSRPPAVILESNLGCSTYIERSNFPHDIPWPWYDGIQCIKHGKTLKKSRLHICPLHIFGSKATDGTYGFEYWSPGFGFDPGPNLQPCEVHSFGFENMAKSHVIHSCFVK